MPRKFFRFPSKEPTTSPPPPPPKVDGYKVSDPIPLTDTIRARRITSPTGLQDLGFQPKRGPPRLPHRASVSDSFTQGSSWRNPEVSNGHGFTEMRTTAAPVVNKAAVANPPRPQEEAQPFPRPLRRSKGHQPIAVERERRAKAEVLLQEQDRLKQEINEETVRLNRIKQMQEAIKNERERVENARKANEIHANISMPSANRPDFYNRYGKSHSTPHVHDSSPYSRGRSTATSRESFQSGSSQEPDYRRVWSRTPSASSNDRSPPTSHWQRIEQARRERERDKAMLKLAEARAMERKAFEEAWNIYESRWMLLSFATRSPQHQANPIMGPSQSPTLTLSFFDIPWPLLHPPRNSEGITTQSIRMFLASEHQTTDRTHRERIKEALLRWHPDRFGVRVLEHVRPDHRAEVEKGVAVVVRCLNELLSKT
jgi:hypothetical protein